MLGGEKEKQCLCLHLFNVEQGPTAGPNAKPKTIKLLGEIGENLGDLGVGKDFFYIKHKNHDPLKNDKLNFIKLKTSAV